LTGAKITRSAARCQARPFRRAGGGRAGRGGLQGAAPPA